MSKPKLLIFGGTSDAREVCEYLDSQKVSYWLSVATQAGVQQSASLEGRLLNGRMDTEEMIIFCRQNQIQQIIDLSHPYAEIVSQNIAKTCQVLAIPLLRYVRPSEIDDINHPLVHKVDSIEQACQVAEALGERILLTTGSKELPEYVAKLPNKTILARVLPTAEVLSLCERAGLMTEQIFALKGPFSSAFNQAFYQYCRADVVITKESGTQGGFKEKVEPCLLLNIPCVILVRPKINTSLDGVIQVHGLDKMKQLLQPSE